MALAFYFSFPVFLMLLVWLALGLMAFWIWSTSKAKAPLCTMIGAFLLALLMLLAMFETMMGSGGIWLDVVGAALITLGYYYTVKPIIDKHIHEIADKAKAKAASGGTSGSSGTPPSA